ncbi:MAG TPA: hypothetical protein VH417_20530 [Vicinamibacterales bacterium]
MSRSLRLFGALAVAVAVASLSAPLGAQGAKPAAKPAAKPWTPPRAADGHADLSGVWSHNAATPFERPKELEGREFLTAQEVANLKRNAAELFNGDTDAAFGDSVFLAALRKNDGFTSTDTTGNYNHFWLVDREFDNRTSLISDPKDGKLPPLTAKAQQQAAMAAERQKLHPFDGPEDIALGERCVTGTVPMFGAGYNNYYQIVQNPNYVGINMEMRHDTRMIPIGSRPHVASGVQLWLGDPRGHWEGDTLVIDSTNFRQREFGAAGAIRTGGLSPSAHLVERLSRTGPNTLRYEVTITDPEIYTKPWTVVMFLQRSTDQVYEYACHEGNEAMSGTLGGERVKERKAAASKTSSK